jgi:dTDP-4-dehydrorhamnose 3,5-epimerase
MEFIETALKGAYLVRLKKIEDRRGYFARGWCQQEFSAQGLAAGMVQLNVASNLKKGTVRGLHYQVAPHQEAKLVRCTRGAMFDVMVDLRPDSPTAGQSVGAELTPDNGLMLYVPEGFAHGYQTLADDTDMYYMASAFYAPAAARGLRYDSAGFNIQLGERRW